MYICCLDRNEDAFVVDLKTGALYVLEKDSDQLTPIRTNAPINQPHDATIFNNRLVLVDSLGNLYELHPNNTPRREAKKRIIPCKELYFARIRNALFPRMSFSSCGVRHIITGIIYLLFGTNGVF